MHDLFSQPEIHSHENSHENEAILNANKEHFSDQCLIVLRALIRGERLTTSVAQEKYHIGDLRARIRDLIKFNGVNIEKQTMKDRYKEYFLTDKERALIADRIMNKVKVN